MKELKLYQNMTIKAVEEKDAQTLIIKGKASVYRSSDGLLTVDRDGEAISLDFMDLDSYRKNPVLCIAHEWSRIVGRVIEIENKNGALEVVAEVHRLTGEEATFEAVQKGLLKSFSIGVIPKEFIYRDGSQGEVLEIARSELVEISLMPVQSNADALFEVIHTKGVGDKLSISKKMLAQQNGMTCDELDGSCAFKSELTTQKEINMDIVTKEANVKTEDELKAEELAKKAEQEAKDLADKEAADKVKDLAEKLAEEKAKEVKAEPAVLDEAALVAALEAVNLKKEELAKQKEEADKQAAEELKAQEEAATKAKIDGAVSYIKERRDEIVNTPNEDFDTDNVEDFYELVSEAAEAIEAKVANIIKAQSTAE